MLLVLIFNSLSCNWGIKREQLAARYHRKTPCPICYSHTEWKLLELEVNYEEESLGEERLSGRVGERREWRCGVEKVHFHCCCAAAGDE